MFQKKKKCHVCGYRFTPERGNVYTAEEPRSVADMLTKPPTRFSAVDCPVCGCQIALAIRAPRFDLLDITEQHDADAEEADAARIAEIRKELFNMKENKHGFEPKEVCREQDDGTDDPVLLPKYCPECGAKMEGGNDNAKD